MTRKIKFYPKSHKYKLGRKDLTSVTQFVKSFFSDFNAKEISKFVAQARRKKGEKVTATQVQKEWKQIAQDGTAVHNEIQTYFSSGDEIEKLSDIYKSLSPKAQKAIGYYYAAFLDLGELYPEKLVYSEKLGLAGTIDLLMYHQETNTVILVDWKTNKAIKTTGPASKNPVTKHLTDCNFVHYTLQLSTYAYILESDYNVTVDKLVLVHLTDTAAIPYDIVYEKATVEEMIKYFQREKHDKEIDR